MFSRTQRGSNSSDLERSLTGATFLTPTSICKCTLQSQSLLLNRHTYLTDYNQIHTYLLIFKFFLHLNKKFKFNLYLLLVFLQFNISNCPNVKKGGIYFMAKLLKWKVFNNFNRCNKMLLQIILQISKSCPYVVIKVQHLPKFLNAVALFSVHNGVKSLMKTEQEGIFFSKLRASLMKFIWFSRTPLQFSLLFSWLGFFTVHTISNQVFFSLDCK